MTLEDRWGLGLKDRLADVAVLCHRAQSLAMLGREWYDSDPELEVPKLACDSVVLKLGEAVRRLPPEFLDSHREDPVWRRAIGMRNRIAHEYDAIDYEIVWSVISVHAEQLLISIRAMVGDSPDPQP